MISSASSTAAVFAPKPPRPCQRIDSGQMDADLVLRMLRHLPHGVTEMYFHPATRGCPEIDRTMPTYRYEREFEALISPTVREAIAAAGCQRVAFDEL